MKNVFRNEFTYRRFLEEGREAEFDRLFDAAVTSVVRTFGKVHPIYIAGKETYSTSTIVETSPINRKTVLGYFQKGGVEHARAAVAAAKAALDSWQYTDYRERAAIFGRFADAVSRDKFQLAAILSMENGKSRYESVGEVDEAIDFARYYSSEMLANKGYSRKVSAEGSGKGVAAGFQGAPAIAEKVRIALRPWGVFGVIAPFNFPVSISAGMSVAAMVTGNTVVFKPSSTDNMAMLTGLRLYEYFKEAGVPDGVFNYVTGPGSVIGGELVASRDVAGIAFTGSRQTGLAMIGSANSLGLQKQFVVEMGGKNPAIVSRSADMDLTASGIVSAAFGFSGQKCSALSRVYVHESVKDQLVSKLVERMRGLKVGDPLKRDVYVGPLISESAFKRHMDAVERIKGSGRLLYGGGRVDTGLDGFYVEPVLAELRQGHELVREELFAPILLIIGYGGFDEAIGMANDTEYGLTAALYSRNRKEVDAFARRIQSGVVYVNRAVSATTGAIVGTHTFVGWKGSGLTGKGTGSRFYLQQFLREQSLAVVK